MTSWGDSQVPSTAVLEAVAEREEVDLTELYPPLFEVLDPDALDALFSASGDSMSSACHHVTFRYHGYELTVYDDGTVDVTEIDESSQSSRE